GPLPPQPPSAPQHFTAPLLRSAQPWVSATLTSIASVNAGATTSAMPQHFTAPLSSRAHARSPSASTCAAPAMPLTAWTPDFDTSFPSPRICPVPQHFTVPSFILAQEKEPPRASSTAPSRSLTRIARVATSPPPPTWPSRL